MLLCLHSTLDPMHLFSLLIPDNSSQPASNPVSQSGTPRKEGGGFPTTASLLQNLMASGGRSASSSSKQLIEVEVRMASVCYVHSASFLDELNSCATDFKVKNMTRLNVEFF